MTGILQDKLYIEKLNETISQAEKNRNREICPLL